jgi:hypothetical protein
LSSRAGREALEFALGFLDVFEAELAGFDEMHDDELGAAAEHGEEFVDEAELGGVARDERLEDVEVADLAGAADDFFGFHAVGGGLDGGVGGAGLCGEGLLDLADGGVAAGPEDFHDVEFEFGEFGSGHGADPNGCISF